MKAHKDVTGIAHYFWSIVHPPLMISPITGQFWDLVGSETGPEGLCASKPHQIHNQTTAKLLLW